MENMKVLAGNGAVTIGTEIVQSHTEIVQSYKDNLLWESTEGIDGISDIPATGKPSEQFKGLSVYGEDEEVTSLNGALQELAVADPDVKEAIDMVISKYGSLNIAFGTLDEADLGKVELGGNDILLNKSLATDSTILKETILRGLIYLLGFDEALHSDVMEKLTNGSDDALDPDISIEQTKTVDIHPHGGTAESAEGAADFLADIDVINANIGLDIEEDVKQAYINGIAEAKNKYGGEYDPSGNRAQRDIVNERVKEVMEIILTKIDEKIDEIITKANGNYDKLTAEEKAFMTSVANWIAFGLHSQDENGGVAHGTAHEKHGIHAMEGSENPDELKAFQLGHFMNAGNDTWIGDRFRSKGSVHGTESLGDNVNGGEALFDLLKEFDNSGSAYADKGFIGMFTSEGKGIQNGLDSAIDAGQISSGWGASGNSTHIKGNTVTGAAQAYGGRNSAQAFGVTKF